MESMHLCYNYYPRHVSKMIVIIINSYKRIISGESIYNTWRN